MTDLFREDRLDIVRTPGTIFEVHGPDGLVARATFRSPAPDWRNVFTVLNRHKRPGTDFVVTDSDDVPLFEFIRERGWNVEFDFRVTTASGDPVGTGLARGRLRARPRTSLLDPTGTPMAHVTHKGVMHVCDAEGQPTATVTPDSTRPAFGKLVQRVEFFGEVTAEVRAMVVATTICWAIS